MSESQDSPDFLSRQHLAFEVESLAQVSDALKQMGITDYEQGEVTFFTHKKYKWCEWRDPNGIRLECVEVI